jgi:hypothetical protein
MPNPLFRVALSAAGTAWRSGLTRWLASASGFLLTTVLYPVVSLSQTHDHHTVEVAPALLTNNVKNELTALTQTPLPQSSPSSAKFSTQSRMSMSVAQSAPASQLIETAKFRHQLLSSIIQEYPEEVLRNAIPSDVRATLPPNVQAYVEEEAEHEGELEVMYVGFPIVIEQKLLKLLILLALHPWIQGLILL